MERTIRNVSMNYQGYLIARERLRNNWSQAGLCKGVCTVSYLSKIESGNAIASDEIISLLFERLGLQYDSALETEAERIVTEGYEFLFTFRLDKLRKLFEKHELKRFRTTEASLNLDLLNAIVSTCEPLNTALESFMDARSLALQRILQEKEDDAVLLYPCGLV